MIGAIDIGGTKIAVGMVDENGRVLSRLECPTDAAAGYRKALERIVQHAAAMRARDRCEDLPASESVPPGRYIPSWAPSVTSIFFRAGEGANIVASDLKGPLTFRLRMENDADAAALAEAGWGAGKDKKRLVYVTVGTGIGSGIILDGRVYRGVDQAHPEIGHHVIDPSGPSCMCGFRGCWESLAAGPAMVAWVDSQASAELPAPHRPDRKTDLRTRPRG